MLDQVQLYLVDQVQREWATGLSEAQVLDLVQYMKLDQVQLLHLRARSNRIKKRPTFLVDPFSHPSGGSVIAAAVTAAPKN